MHCTPVASKLSTFELVWWGEKLHRAGLRCAWNGWNEAACLSCPAVVIVVVGDWPPHPTQIVSWPDAEKRHYCQPPKRLAWWESAEIFSELVWKVLEKLAVLGTSNNSASTFALEHGSANRQSKILRNEDVNTCGLWKFFLHEEIAPKFSQEESWVFNAANVTFAFFKFVV